MARPEDVSHGHLHGELVMIRFERLCAPEREFVMEKGYGPDTVARVVMVSSMGDVGLTRRLAAERGYDLRLDPPKVRVLTGRDRETAKRLVKLARAARGKEMVTAAMAAIYQALEAARDEGPLADAGAVQFIHHPNGALVDATRCPRHAEDEEVRTAYRREHGSPRGVELPCMCRLVARVIYASEEVEAAAVEAIKRSYERNAGAARRL